MKRLQASTWLVAASLIAGGAALTTLSAQAADPVAAQLKSWDPDSDGTLDWNEVKAAAEAKFDSLEKDKDGTLDKKEVAGLGISASAFKKADPDKDGTLDKAEYLSIVEARFKAANPDKDNTIELKELKTSAGKSLLKLLK